MKSSSSHKKKSEGEMKDGKREKKMKGAVSEPIDIPNAAFRRQQRDTTTFVIGSPPASSFLRSGDHVDSSPSPDEDDFYAAENTPEASEMKEEMQPDKDHGKKPWELIHQEDAVYITMDMPGVTKETVKAHVEDGILFIKGAKETSARISLMPVIPQYKMSEMKGEVKNGVVNIMIPKVKEGERTDIFHVQFD